MPDLTGTPALDVFIGMAFLFFLLATVVSAVNGWLVSAAAISLGTLFWFDVLGKLSRLRGTGNREGTEKDDKRAPEDRDDPSRRRLALG